jgi:hypothetical protein
MQNDAPHEEATPYVRSKQKLVSLMKIKIKILKDQLEAAENELRGLEAELQPKNRLIYFLSSPRTKDIGNLPEELLVDIFRLALLDDHPRIYDLLLVSKQWNAIVMNTPCLWTTIDLVLPSPSGIGTMESTEAYHNACIQRSGDMLLDISFKAGEVDRSDVECIFWCTKPVRAVSQTSMCHPYLRRHGRLEPRRVFGEYTERKKQHKSMEVIIFGASAALAGNRTTFRGVPMPCPKTDRHSNNRPGCQLLRIFRYQGVYREVVCLFTCNEYYRPCSVLRTEVCTTPVFRHYLWPRLGESHFRSIGRNETAASAGNTRLLRPRKV